MHSNISHILTSLRYVSHYIYHYMCVSWLSVLGGGGMTVECQLFKRAAKSKATVWADIFTFVSVKPVGIFITTFSSCVCGSGTRWAKTKNDLFLFPHTWFMYPYQTKQSIVTIYVVVLKISLTWELHWLDVCCGPALQQFCPVLRRPSTSHWLRFEKSAVQQVQTAGVARPRRSRANDRITRDHSYTYVLWIQPQTNRQKVSFPNPRIRRNAWVCLFVEILVFQYEN